MMLAASQENRLSRNNFYELEMYFFKEKTNMKQTSNKL